VDIRVVVAAAAVVVAGCGSQAAALGSHTAQVTINGKDIGSPLAVNCSQGGWTWLIESPGEKAGFAAAIETGATPAAHSVQIRDLGGFTGSFWEGTVGKGEARVGDGTFTISGTAEGSYASDPTGEATATFEIRTSC
jgi:ipoprotein LpqH